MQTVLKRMHQTGNDLCNKSAMIPFSFLINNKISTKSLNGIANWMALLVVERLSVFNRKSIDYFYAIIVTKIRFFFIFIDDKHSLFGQLKRSSREKEI